MTMRLRSKLWSSLSLSASLSACAVGPNYRPESASALKVPAQYQSTKAATQTPVDLATWWTSFNDPVLAQLVTRALAANNDIDAAEARLRAARASVKGARGALLPTVGGSASASDSEIVRGVGAGGDNYQVGLDASWEADIFGGNRRSLEASRATAQGARATLYDVQRSIAAEVALNYIDARNTQARLAVARANLGYQDETVQIAGWRVQAGLVSALDVEQAKVLRAQTAATIPQLEQTYASDANRIAVLTGEAPGAVTPLLDARTAIPLAPDAVEVGLPADLLRRRPDVMASEASLAAEVARIGVVEAQLYPALRLSGSLSSSAFSLGDIGSSILGNLIGSLTAPIFQGGQLRARVEGQRATADAALASYRGTVLRALEDVENAMVAIDKTKAREVALAVAETSAQTSVLYARNRYRAGLIDFQTLLESERSLLSSQDSRTSARAARATASVQLYKALGGGWSPDDISGTRP
jgi:outer membrane protein, multidrug efflux system